MISVILLFFAVNADVIHKFDDRHCDSTLSSDCNAESQSDSTEAFSDFPDVAIKLTELGFAKLRDILGLKEDELDDLADLLDLTLANKLRFKSNVRILRGEQITISVERLSLAMQHVNTLESLFQRYLWEMDERVISLKASLEEQIDQWQSNKRRDVEHELKSMQFSKEDIQTADDICNGILRSHGSVEDKLRQIDTVIDELFHKYDYLPNGDEYIFKFAKLPRLVSNPVVVDSICIDFNEQFMENEMDHPNIALNEPVYLRDISFWNDWDLWLMYGGVFDRNGAGDDLNKMLLTWTTTADLVYVLEHENGFTLKYRDGHSWYALDHQDIISYGRSVMEQRADGLHSISYTVSGTLIDVDQHHIVELQVELQLDEPVRHEIQSNVIRIER